MNVEKRLAVLEDKMDRSLSLLEAIATHLGVQTPAAAPSVVDSPQSVTVAETKEETAPQKPEPPRASTSAKKKKNKKVDKPNNDASNYRKQQPEVHATSSNDQVSTTESNDAKNSDPEGLGRKDFAQKGFEFNFSGNNETAGDGSGTPDTSSRPEDVFKTLGYGTAKATSTPSQSSGKNKNRNKNKDKNQGDTEPVETSLDEPIPQLIDAEKEESQDAEEQLAMDIRWSIWQLRKGIKNLKPTKDQEKDAKKSINTFMSTKAPAPKKRMLMRKLFGDYMKEIKNDPLPEHLRQTPYGDIQA